MVKGGAFEIAKAWALARSKARIKWEVDRWGEVYVVNLFLGWQGLPFVEVASRGTALGLFKMREGRWSGSLVYPLPDALEALVAELQRGVQVGATERERASVEVTP